jgi:hypothetical protein
MSCDKERAHLHLCADGSAASLLWLCHHTPAATTPGLPCQLLDGAKDLDIHSGSSGLDHGHPGSRSRSPPRNAWGSGCWANLEEVIASLQHVFPSSLFKQAPVGFPPLSDGNQVEYLKVVVRSAAARYGLRLHKLAVRFTRDIPENTCGRIRQDGAAVYVDFAEKYRDNDTALIAIVAARPALAIVVAIPLPRGAAAPPPFSRPLPESAGT